MSEKQEPKKPRRPKHKRLKLSPKQRWEDLLREVKKEQVPVDVLLFMVVHLKDGTDVEIDVQRMLEDGYDPDEIERNINEKLTDLDAYIHDVDFHVSVESVAKVVQPFTDNLLKNL
jgi:hypothetical protein